MFMLLQAIHPFANAGSKRERSVSLESSTMNHKLGIIPDSRAVLPYFSAFNGNDKEELNPFETTTHTIGGLKLNRGEAAQLKAERQIAWLESELVNRPGYGEFKSSRNCPKNYAAVMQTWDFATKFDKEYSDTMHGVSTQTTSSNFEWCSNILPLGLQDGEDYEQSGSRRSQYPFYMDVKRQEGCATGAEIWTGWAV